MAIRIDSGVRERLDAGTPNTSVFFARELESIEARVYEVKKREMKSKLYIPVSNRDPAGAETITYRMFDKVGMSQVVSNWSDDIPRADVFGKEYTQPVKSLAISFGYNVQEIEAAMMAGVSLDMMKADAARRGHLEKEDRIAWNGDADSGIKGFLDNENIPTLAVPTGVGGYTWALKTADEILLDIGLATSQIKQTSKGVFQANVCLLPRAQYDKIATTPRSSTSDTTILQYVLNNKAAYGIEEFGVLDVELDNRFVGATADGAVFYERSPEVLEQRIPKNLTPLPVEVRGLEYIINFHARNGGVVVRYPIACLFLTGI